MVSKKSEIVAAIRYAPGRWGALLRYAEDGHIEINNNSAERALRVVATTAVECRCSRRRTQLVASLEWRLHST
jgi:hypothetical protein